MTSQRKVILSGDLSNHNKGSQRIENVYRIDGEPSILDIRSVSNLVDGQTSVTVRSNINEKLMVGDLVNVFRKRGEQFSRVHLPVVNKDMVLDETTLKIMIVKT